MKVNGDLMKGSFILLFSFGVYNFLNFIFQFSMARMLNLSDYGILAALFSIIYMLTVFTESIQIIIMKYSSNESSAGKLKYLIHKSLNKSFIVALFLFGIYLIISLLLKSLLDIPYYLLAFNGLIIFSSLFLPITRGVLQGRKLFGSLGLNMIYESSLKLIFAVFFVFIGWNVFGAIAGTILGVGFAFGLSFIPLKRILFKKKVHFKTEGVYEYAKPAFFITLIIVMFYSIDIIIAKIVFSSELAGAYAISSILSKSIFWGTQPISRVMFPLVSKGKSNNKESGTIFTNAFVFLITLIVIALGIFHFFPGLIIKIFSGKEIVESIGILFILGLGTSVISIANLVLLYKLSLNKTKGYAYLFLFVLIEAFLLFYFSANLFQFSIAFMTSSFALLWASLFMLNERT